MKSRNVFCYGINLAIFFIHPISNGQSIEDVVDFLSWEKVKSVTDAKNYINAELDGFIQFQGDTNYPTVILWQNSEAMKYERPFMSVTVNSESISPMLLEPGQAPSSRWKLIDGKYVKIRGVFRDQKRGFDYIDLGRFEKIFEITIFVEDGKAVRYALNQEPVESTKGSEDSDGQRKKGE